ELAIRKRDVLDRRFENMARDLQPLLDDLVRGVEHDDAAEPERPAGMRAAADRDALGVAGHEPDAVDRHAEPLGDQLCEARLVPLALRYGADDDLDRAADRPVRLHGHFRLLARCAGRGVDIIRNPDAAAFAAPPRFRAPRRKTMPVAEPERARHDAVMCAAVIDR